MAKPNLCMRPKLSAMLSNSQLPQCFTKIKFNAQHRRTSKTERTAFPSPKATLQRQHHKANAAPSPLQPLHSPPLPCTRLLPSHPLPFSTLTPASLCNCKSCLHISSAPHQTTPTHRLTASWQLKMSTNTTFQLRQPTNASYSDMYVNSISSIPSS